MNTNAVRFNQRFLRNARQYLIDVRARYPIKHAVEPLPDREHTHTDPPSLSDYERRQREKWNFDGK